MKFNVKKCKIMRITKKKQPLISSFFPRKLQTGIEEVKEFKNLGIITKQHLSWNLHIDYVVFKANSILGLIGRTCNGLDDPIAHWFAQTWNTVLWCGLLILKEILITGKGTQKSN